MSFFDDAGDLDAIPDDPFALPDNTYKVRIIEARYGPTQGTKDSETPKFGITLKYQITEGKYSSFFPFTEWLHSPGKDDDKDALEIQRSYSTLKKHFLALGFAVTELNDIKPDNGRDKEGTVPMLVDREAYVKTVTRLDKNKRKQIQINDITPVDGATDTGSDSGDSNSAIDF